MKPIEDKNEQGNKVFCSFCQSENIIKRGQRKTKNRGLIQRFFCNDCKKRFILNDGFFRMRNSPEKITQALHLYFSGASLRKAQEHLGVFHSHNASQVSILKWLRKYAHLVGGFTDRLQLKASHEIQLDEMEFKTKKRKSWFIDIIDAETRYMVSSGYFMKRNGFNATQVLRGAKNKTGEQVKEVWTDGNQMYPRILRKVFSLNKCKTKSKIEHFAKIASEDGFNHKIERLHNSVRERTKIMRQFKRLHSAKAIMKGFEIHYNFCRKHQAIKCYPYQLATDLQLGRNKWLDLIKIATK